MALTTKVVTLDGGGNGTVNVMPMFYVGASKPVSVESGTAGGQEQLGDTFRTRGNAQFVVGDINISGGTADEDVALYFIAE